MDNTNNPPYGQYGDAPYYPPPQAQYAPPQGPPYQQPTQYGPGQQQGYYPNTNQPQQPPAPGMPPAQPSYPAYGQQQPGLGYQGHSSYGHTASTTGNFDPGVPQYSQSQQLSPPQTYGYQPPPSPTPAPAPASAPSYGYTPQNPPPLPPRSPAAQYSFAPPPSTAIQSKASGTLGRLGAKVAGTVQSKVKDYLLAKQGNVQSASLSPGPPGTTPTTPTTQQYGYGYGQSSQPWQGQTENTRSYPTSTPEPAGHNEPTYGYQPAQNLSTQPYGSNQSNSPAITQNHAFAESGGPSGGPSTAVSPPAVINSPAAPPPAAAAISAPAPAQAQTFTSAPVPTIAPAVSPVTTPASQSISIAPPPPPPAQNHQAPQPMSPEPPLVENSQHAAPQAHNVQSPSQTEVNQPNQGSGQDAQSQAADQPQQSSMTWGWNWSFNPAAQALGDYTPQLQLTPMFKIPSPAPESQSARDETTKPAELPSGPEASGPHAPVIAATTVSPPPTRTETTSTHQVPQVPAKIPLQAPLPPSSGSRPSNPPPSQSQPDSVGFQPYRPSSVEGESNSASALGLNANSPSPSSPPPAPESTSTPQPLNIAPAPGDPSLKQNPEPQKFQPYRAPGSDQMQESASESPNSHSHESSTNSTTAADNGDAWFSQTSVFSTSLYGSTPAVQKVTSPSSPSEIQEHPAALSPGGRAGPEHPPSLSPGPLATQEQSWDQRDQQTSNSTTNPLNVLGDLITDHLQNMTISDTPSTTNQSSVPADSPNPLQPISAPTPISSANVPSGSQNQQPQANNLLTHSARGPNQGSPYQDEYFPYPMLTAPMHRKAAISTQSDSSKPPPSRFCFGSDPAVFPRFYHSHPEALAFPICTWCYATFIAPSSLASAFPESLGATASGVMCGFHVPRVTKLLWPAAVRSGDLSDLLQYMNKRWPTLPPASEDPNAPTSEAGNKADKSPEIVVIKPCRRPAQFVSIREGYRWYKAPCPGPEPSTISEMAVCESCYEEYILAAPSFAAKFTGPHTQGQDELLGCDFAFFPSIERAFLKYGPVVGDWERFLREAIVRLEMGARLSSCNGFNRKVTDCKWWTLKGFGAIVGSLPRVKSDYSLTSFQGGGHFFMCEPCYMDAVLGTRFEDTVFEMVVEESTEGWAMWDHRWCTERLCTYSARKNQVIVDAFTAADVRKLSPETLHSMLKEIASKPRCVQMPNGIEDGLFYNFPAAEHVDDYGICEGHYISTIKGFGLDQFFGETPRQVPGRAYCAFHPQLVRAQMWINKLNEAIDTGDFDIYHKSVRTFAAIPPCPRRDAVANRHWYGWFDCSICPDCFEQFAAGTALVKDMPSKNVFSQQLIICCMYSPRQRALYTKACETGDVTELLAVSAERTKIWNKTVPRMTVLYGQQVIANGKAMLASSLAHMHATSNAISLGDDGTRYTSTTSGNTYQSYDGILAEKYRNEAAGLEAKLRGMDPGNERMYLAALWESVE